jgi:hypothetical protein
MAGCARGFIDRRVLATERPEFAFTDLSDDPAFDDFVRVRLLASTLPWALTTF